jgi:hypothetical protein
VSTRSVEASTWSLDPAMASFEVSVVVVEAIAVSSEASA